MQVPSRKDLLSKGVLVLVQTVLWCWRKARPLAYWTSSKKVRSVEWQLMLVREPNSSEVWFLCQFQNQSGSTEILNDMTCKPTHDAVHYAVAHDEALYNQ